MLPKISVVINTLNEESNIEQAVKSVDWTDEIVVVDDGSIDKTVEIIRKLKIDSRKLKIFQHKSAGYVEPARNFAVSKATGDWILILDADEEIPTSLSARLKQIASKMKQIMYVRIPRKNIIFNKWMKNSGWWPDYNVRFFRKGSVKWTESIHRPPEVSGEGLDLEADEKWAIIHYNYQSIPQFIERMNLYTTIEAEKLNHEGYKFNWKDLLKKPLDEFLSRFFANRGYEDGLHGLALSLLQASSFLVVYLKVWESLGFKENLIGLAEIDEEKKKAGDTLNYWIKKTGRSKSFFKRIFNKLI